MPFALTREVSRAISECELTHVPRVPIDLEVARAQHRAYEAALESLGFPVERVAEAPALADSVFVEDVAVVFPELAVMTRPGAESRRAEGGPVAEVLGRHRSLARIEAPGTLDGGDVLVLDKDVVVGDTSRSNAEGVAQLGRLLAPHGYRVRHVPVRGALHLKSAVTRVGDRVLLVNPEWVDLQLFRGWMVLHVDASEPFAANALWLGGAVILSESFPRTRARLEAMGIRVMPVPASELAKAEGGVTCCSLIVS
jgi:dimethylargininase